MTVAYSVTAEIQSIESYEEWDEPDFKRATIHRSWRNILFYQFSIEIADEQRTKGMNLDCLFFMTRLDMEIFPLNLPPYPVAWIVTETYMKIFRLVRSLNYEWIC